MRICQWAMAIVVLSLVLIVVMIFGALAVQPVGADAAGLTGAAASSTPATVIAVTTTEDELNSDGDCSLREAVQAANTDTAVDACPAGSGKDTISLPAHTYTLSIPSTDEDANADGDLDIISDIVLQGADAATTIIQAGTSWDNGIARVLHVLGGSELTAAHVTIQYGLATGNSPHNRGGGIYNDGGTVTVTHCILNFNRAVGSNSIYGAGIYNHGGTVLVAYSTLTMNRVEYSEDGRGGGIYSSNGVVTLDHSVLHRNSLQDGFDGYGGGMYIDGGTVTIIDSTLDDNRVHGATADGGGIYNNGGKVALTNSTVSNNRGASDMGGAMGGGIYNNPIGTVLLTNSTLSGNSATDGFMGDPGRGGGILNNGGAVTLSSSTLSENEASTGGGILVGSGGAVTVTNSIIAHSIGEDCDGTIVSRDCNIDSDNTCSLTQPHDQPNTDPRLDPLADNGGPTWTHALQDESPAIDAGDCSGGTIDEDQRGATRPQGDACDIGAYEYGVLTTDDTYWASEDISLTVAAPGVLWNDFSPQGLTTTVGTAPVNGTLVLHVDGSFVYTPTLNFHGVDWFTYIASDGALTDTATVTLTVTAVNDAPLAVGDAYTTTEDLPLTVAAPGVLANDSDVDGDALTAVLDSPPLSGTLALNLDGSFTYTPTLDFYGADAFTYHATDTISASNVATVALTVEAQLSWSIYLPVAIRQ
jgi:CSLREA domain-containing protein